MTRSAGLPRAGADAAGLEDLPDGGRCDLDPQTGELTMDPAVSPAGVLASQPEDQCPDVPAGGWPAGLASHGPGGPAADDVTVPEQDRVRGDQQPQPVAAGFRYHAEQGRQECPVRPAQLRRRGCCRCGTASWWRRIKISTVFHVSSRRASRNHAASRVVRRDMNRRHMTDDHHGRTAGRATLLVRAVDEILSTDRAGG